MKSIGVIVAALGIGSMVGLCLPKADGPERPRSRSGSAVAVPEARPPAPNASPKSAVSEFSGERVAALEQPKGPIIITTSSILGRRPPAPATYSPPPSHSSGATSPSASRLPTSRPATRC